MKKLKFFLSALMISAIAFNACKDDPKPEPEKPLPEIPEVEAVSGKIVLVLHCVNEAQVCNDLVFAGDYNGWDLAVSALAKFEPIPEYDGWFKVELTPSAVGNGGIEGKPNQLDSDGTFPSDWAHQWFAQTDDAGNVINECEIIKGDAELDEEYNGEKKLIMFSTADVVYIKAYAWKVNPCVPAVTYEVTFNVTVPSGLGEDDKVYIVGGMNNWTPDATPLTKSGNNWTITLQNIAFGTEYKYVLNGDWAWEELGATSEAGCANAIANRSVTDRTMNDAIPNFRDVTAERCSNVTFEVTVPEGLGEDHIVYIAGGMTAWGENAQPLEKQEDGTWKITFEDFIPTGTPYKYLINGDWDHEELAAIEEGADCANTISNRTTTGATNNDTVENFRGITAERCPSKN